MNAKRLLSAILALCMLFGMVQTTFAAEPGHVHNFATEKELKPATCTERGISGFYCECGDVQYRSTDFKHDYDMASAVITKEPNCAGGEAKAKCKICGAEGIVQLEGNGQHSWKAVELPATCKNPKRKGEVCEVCGAERNMVNVDDKLGNHSFDYVVTTEPDCNKEGLATWQCTVCGEKEEHDPPTKAVSSQHTWDNGVYVDATCTEDGHMLFTCTKCKATRTETSEAFDKALGHDYKSVNVPATCKEAGYKGEQCSRCKAFKEGTKEELPIDSNAHKYDNGSNIKDPDCTTSGIKRFVCSLCGNIKYEAVPAAHTWVVTETTKAATCEAEGLGKAECAVCGAKDDNYVLKALGHDMQVQERVEPTCGKDGKEVKKCSRCDKKEEKVLKATGKHTYVDNMYLEADCTHAARKGQYCTVCGDEKNMVIQAGSSALGHKWVEKVTKAPTCVKDGEKAQVCERCGVTKENSTEVVPQTGHKLVPTGKGIIPADCDNPASEEMRCTVCNEIVKNPIQMEDGSYLEEAKGHTWEKSGKPATCKEKGYSSFKCKTCGYEITSADKDKYVAQYGDNIKWTELPVDTETGHKRVHKETLREATCTEAGIFRDVCELCGKDMGYSSEKLKHNMVYKETKVAAQCEKSDGTDIYKCSVCGVEKERTVSKDHTWDAGIVTKEATCGAAGEKKFTCTRCGATKTEEIKATGKHTWSEEEQAIAATCQHPDQTGIVCTVCGAVKEGTAKNVAGSKAIGHNYVKDTKKSKDAKCGVAGELVEVCSMCGDVKTTPVKALEHKWVSNGYSPADCTNPEGEKFTCELCGEVKVTEFTGDLAKPALGHKWKEKTVAGTCKNKGYRTYTCENCKYEITKADGNKYPGYVWTELPINPDNHTIDAKNPAEVLKEAKCAVKDKDAVTGIGRFQCKDCDYTEYRVIQPEHKYDYKTTKEANCGVNGEKEGICSVCGKEVKETIKASGKHTEVEGIWKDATCKEGAKVGKYCSVCNEALGAMTTVGDPLGHAWEEKVTKDPTCTEVGKVELICTRCKAKDTKDIPMIPHNYAVEVEPANCGHGDRVKSTCTVCGDVTYSDLAGGNPATGAHDMKENVVVPGDCQTAGYTVAQKCSVCGYEEGDVTPGEKDPSNHKKAVQVEVLREGKCAQDDKDAVSAIIKYQCPDCKEYFYQQKTAEHAWGEPYANDAGTAVLRKCKNCGKVEVVTKLDGFKECGEDHTPVNDPYVAPTYDAPGHEAGTHCAVCGKVLSGNKEIPKLTATPEPTEAPSEQPSETPTEAPSETPTEAPSETPTEAPSEEPTEAPSEEPSETPHVHEWKNEYSYSDDFTSLTVKHTCTVCGEVTEETLPL